MISQFSESSDHMPSFCKSGKVKAFRTENATHFTRAIYEAFVEQKHKTPYQKIAHAIQISLALYSVK